MNTEAVERAKRHFGEILERELARVERMKKDSGSAALDQLDTIVIGVVGGDGIGPYIAEQAERLLRHALAEPLGSGRVVIKTIEGLTIENRVEKNQAIPDDVLEELRKCHVILKGPTTTPRKGDKWPNIESANVAMRRAFDLFANVRPVKVPEEGIDWVFFRENTEGAYILGSHGIEVTDDLAVDFTSVTTQGCERIIRAAFEYAKNNRRRRVTAVTKANVVKTTDGKFLRAAEAIAEEYPDIDFDDWYIDIMTAKLIDESRRSSFDVMVLPNLYGDILTDEAAQFQGGVGTAGSANIGTEHAMFEAIHGSAPRMVDEGRAQYADPSSLMRASAMLLEHIGYTDEAARLTMALDVCGQYERRVVLTGRDTGASNDEYTDYVAETMDRSDLVSAWESYQT